VNVMVRLLAKDENNLDEYLHSVNGANQDDSRIFKFDSAFC